MNGISRRDLLKQLAAGGLLAAAPGSLLLGPDREVFQPLAARLTRILSNTRSAAIVGQHYLRLNLEAADAPVLAARIAGTMEHYLRLSSAGPRRLRALLAEQQKRDFAEGRTVNVDGWILSVTEARLCAIAALGFVERRHIG